MHLRTESAALAAGGGGHVAADEEGDPTEHLPFDQFGIVADELPDTPGELLVVGHGDDRTDRRTRGHESFGASLPGGALGRIRRPPHLRLCRFISALVSLLFLPLLPLFPILLPLILALWSCMLILLLLPITPRHWRASAVHQDHPEVRQ
jgi:hypothetical protein